MIDFNPVTEYLFGIVVVIVIAAGTWLVARVGSYFNIKKNGELDNQINQWVHLAITAALEKVYALGGNYTKEVENDVVANAANNLIRFAPELLAKFGYSPEDIRKLIEARLYDIEYDDADTN